jgi:hypothetical protein
VFGELATRYAADVQLQQAVVVRRIGERERPSLAVLEQDVDVLAGEKLQTLAARQSQFNDHHVRSRAQEPVYARRQGTDRYVGERADFPALDAEVGSRRGAAEEGEAGKPVGFAQNGSRRVAVRHLAAENPTATAAADAIAAAVGKVQPLPECGSEDAFVRGDGEGMPARLYNHLVIHCLSVRVPIR